MNNLLTWSTWMACILSGPVPWTRNKAVLSLSHVSSVSPLCVMDFLYAGLMPPYIEMPKTNGKRSILYILFYCSGVRYTTIWNKSNKLIIDMLICTLKMISDLKIAKNSTGSLPSKIWACIRMRGKTIFRQGRMCTIGNY